MSHQQTENGGNHTDVAGSTEEEPEWELDVNEALKELSPTALDLLHVLSMFDGAAICQDLPVYTFELRRRSFVAYLRALNQLKELTLVTRSEFWKLGRPTTLQVHHSVQDIVRNGLNLDESQKVVNSSVLALHHSLPRVSPDNFYDLHGVQDAKLIRPHVADFVRCWRSEALML